MRAVYIRLENYAGLMVGQNTDFIEINFGKSGNKIVSIQGQNGSGKTILLSSITPFAYVPSIDERSSLPLIIVGKNGYKEIHYENNGDVYIIKHYFKANKETHSLKSYFSLNGEELNETGNVTSFLSLVEVHFGITQDTMRLIRLGTNVSSFVDLTPARRKEYIGKLIEEIDVYLKIYKKINEDLRIIKVLLSANDRNLYNCHISDIVVEEDLLVKLNKQVRERERERDGIISKISKIQSLEKENSIDELRRKRQEAEASLLEFSRTEESISSLSLHNVTVDQLIIKRTGLIDSRIDNQSKINSYRISIDSTLKNIERIEVSVKKAISDSDFTSLINAIDNLKISIKNSEILIARFVPSGCSSDELYQLTSKLASFNQISQMIYTFGKLPVEIYIKLRRENKSVDKFLKDQMKKNFTRIGDNEIQRLLDYVFQNDMIITPNCDTQYVECPYYRFSEMIYEFRDKLQEESYDDETLRYVQVISNNIDNIMNSIDSLVSIMIPDKLRDYLREKILLDRLDNQLPFFDLSDFQEYLSILKEYEVYNQNVDKLREYEQRLAMYKNSGVDSQLNEIKQLRANIEFYNTNITTLSNTLSNISRELVSIDEQIGLVTKYNDAKKYRSVIQSTLESTNKILIPLESSSQEKMGLSFSLTSINGMIESLRQEAKDLESKINEYKRLLSEKESLTKKHNDLSLIMEAVSTKKGIPVIYMKTYLGKIQKLANNLLSIIYGDEFRLAKFKVTTETFDIPYIKNGTKIPDVKYASQAEVALTTMALSFALANRLSGTYNILLLDEIDGGLDDKNRSAFLKMLDRQMNELKAEQVFIISHNLNHINVPVDVIKLSDLETSNRLENIIYGA